MPVPPSARPADTTAEVRALQVGRWRTMAPAEKLDIVAELNGRVRVMAEAGIRRASPGLSEVDLRRQLTLRRHGRALSEAAYGRTTG